MTEIRTICKFTYGGKGVRGMGAGKQVKAGLTGDKVGTPPPAGTTVAV